MTSPTRALTDHALGVEFADLSEDAVQAVKVFLLDTIGVAISGANAAYAAEVRNGLDRWSASTEARVIGTSQWTSAGSAALISAFNAHCQEYDCVHEGAVVHPLATIAPASLAWIDRARNDRKVTGQELIATLAAGVDVSTTIGMASNTTLTFFRPATAGVFGTTAALCRLAGLTGDIADSAFGLALAQCSGTMQPHDEGLCTLAVQVGLGARSGLLAIDMASAGVPGPHDWLEGPHGYLKLFEEDWTIAPLVAELGTRWRITDVSHKPFPSGRATHGAVDGILQLRDQGLTAESLESLDIHVPPLIDKLVGRPVSDDMGVNYARLCLQYVGALALANGTIEVTDYTPERIRDEQIQALAKRVHIIVDGNPDPNALSPQTVTATDTDGKSWNITVPDTLGSPANPLTREQHLTKFRRNWQHAPEALKPGNCEAVIAMVDDLDNLDDVTRLLDLTCP